MRNRIEFQLMKHIINSKKLIGLIWIVIFIGCSNPSKNSDKKNAGETKKDTTLQKTSGRSKDTLKVDFPAAVFFSPDSFHYNKLKVITDSALFESIMHECVYQMGYSRRTIEQHWQKLKILDSKSSQVLLFKSKDDIIEYIDLPTRQDPCGLLVFDGRKKPILVDMTNVDTEIGYYLKD